MITVDFSGIDRITDKAICKLEIEKCKYEPKETAKPSFVRSRSIYTDYSIRDMAELQRQQNPQHLRFQDLYSMRQRAFQSIERQHEEWVRHLFGCAS